MKLRQGFVSNSSSSSFLLDKSKLTSGQICQIHNHIEEANRLGIDNCSSEYDAWSVNDRIEGKIIVSTMMDNFGMREFLEAIGASEAIIKRGDSYACWCDW